MPPARHDNAAVLQSDERDKHTDAHRDGVAQIERNGVDNGLAYLKDGQEDEHNTLDEHSRQRLLPRIAHDNDQRVGEESIDAHARCQRKWHLGIECHHQRGNGGCDDGGREDGAFVHACLTEDNGVDGKDVTHGQKSGKSCQHFSLYAVLGSIKSE